MAQIVLIEDEQLLIDFYKDVLVEIGGFDLKVIPTIKEAFAYVEKLQQGKEKKPDLILLDIIMQADAQDPQSMYLLQKIKTHPETKDIKTFVFTNYSDPRTLRHFKEKGADKILIKIHFEPKELIYLFKKETGLEQ